MMIGTPKRETCSPLTFGLRPIKFESRNCASSIPFLWKGKGLAEGERRPKPTSAPSGHLLPREGGKKKSGIATIYTLRRFYIFMRRTNPFEPFEPIEPAEPFRT